MVRFGVLGRAAQVVRNGSWELGAELEEHDEGALAKDVRQGPLRIVNLRRLRVQPHTHNSQPRALACLARTAP